MKGGEKEVGHLSQPRCKTGPAGINEGTRNIHIQKRDRWLNGAAKGSHHSSVFSLSLSLYDFFLSLVHCCWSDGGRAMCALALANGPYFSILRLSLSLSGRARKITAPPSLRSLSLSLSVRGRYGKEKRRRTHWGEILNKRTATNIYKHVDIYTHVDVYTHSLFFPSLFLSAVRFSYLADFFRLPDSAPLFFLFQLLSHVCKIELWRRISQTKKHITSQTDKKENYYFFFQSKTRRFRFILLGILFDNRKNKLFVNHLILLMPGYTYIRYNTGYILGEQ